MIKNLSQTFEIPKFFSKKSSRSDRRSIRKTPHIKKSIGFLFLLRERHFRSALFSPSPPSSYLSSFLPPMSKSSSYQFHSSKLTNFSSGKIRTDVTRLHRTQERREETRAPLFPLAAGPSPTLLLPTSSPRFLRRNLFIAGKREANQSVFTWNWTSSGTWSNTRGKREIFQDRRGDDFSFLRLPVCLCRCAALPLHFS